MKKKEPTRLSQVSAHAPPFADNWSSVVSDNMRDAADHDDEGHQAEQRVDPSLAVHAVAGQQDLMHRGHGADEGCKHAGDRDKGSRWRHWNAAA